MLLGGVQLNSQSRNVEHVGCKATSESSCLIVPCLPLEKLRDKLAGKSSRVIHLLLSQQIHPYLENLQLRSSKNKQKTPEIFA